MDDKFAKWEKIRQKGKWNYIIKYGVLTVGLGGAIVANLLSFFISRECFWEMIPTYLIALPVGGICYGFYTWYDMEKAYMKSKTMPPEENNRKM